MQIIKPIRKKSYRAEGLRVSIDAGELANDIADAVLERIRDYALQGLEPNGTPKPATKRHDGPRTVTKRRRFFDSIGRRKGRGKRVARAAITYQAFFRTLMRQEINRGIDHFSIPDDVIDEVVKKHLKKSVK
jgi:hypothetical protein